MRDISSMWSPLNGPAICNSFKVIEDKMKTLSQDSSLEQFSMAQPDRADSEGKRMIGEACYTDPDNHIMKVCLFMREANMWYESMLKFARANAAVAMFMISLLISITVICASRDTWPLAPVIAALILSFVNVTSMLVCIHVAGYVVVHYHWRAVIMTLVKQQVNTRVRPDSKHVEDGQQKQWMKYYGTQPHDNDEFGKTRYRNTGHDRMV